jgi:superoxide dismutase, Fe-Mn family
MFKLAPLPYAYDALEPVISEATLHIHHDKHHQGYIDKLNMLLEGIEDFEYVPIVELLENMQSIPQHIRTAVKQSGGQHFNHEFYWHSLTPGGTEIHDNIEQKLITEFGSVEVFRELLNGAASSQFGSGWAWLSVDKAGTLVVESTSNEDNPLFYGRTPLLTIDVWEHAYYLDYQNKRVDYITHTWDIIDWDMVEQRYQQTLKV